MWAFARELFVFLAGFLPMLDPLYRGVARKFLEGGSKSSKILAAMFDRQRIFWVKEWLKR